MWLDGAHCGQSWNVVSLLPWLQTHQHEVDFCCASMTDVCFKEFKGMRGNLGRKFSISKVFSFIPFYHLCLI